MLFPMKADEGGVENILKQRFLEFKASSLSYFGLDTERKISKEWFLVLEGGRVHT